MAKGKELSTVANVAEISQTEKWPLDLIMSAGNLDTIMCVCECVAAVAAQAALLRPQKTILIYFG